MPTDPFGTTYQGAYQAGAALGQLGTGLESAAGDIGGVLAKQNQQKQTLAMLRQMGIIKPNELTSDDLLKSAQEQLGKDYSIKIDSTLPKDQQMKTLQTIFQASGLKMPEPKGYHVDLDKAAQAGMSWNPATGETIFKPMSMMPSFTEQANAQNIFKAKQDSGEISKDLTLNYDAKGHPVLKPKSGFGVAQIRFAEENAPIIADQFEQGDVSGYLNSNSITRTAVASELQKRGIKDIDEKVLGYSSEKQIMGNARIQDAKVNNAISAQTLLNASYDPKTGDYKVPPSMHVELALSVARMLSQTGVVPYDMVQELRQRTAREGLAGVAIFLGFDPLEVGGSTQSVINLFAKTIQREGMASETMRDKYSTTGGGSSFKSFLDKSVKPKDRPDVMSTPLGQAGQKAAGGLKVGTIEEGYKYIGGDPGNPKSWEKQ